MKKTILRSLSIFLGIILLIGAFPIGVSAAEETSSAFEYSILEDGTLELTSYIGSDADVIIPETIDGKTVTKVNELCFYNKDDFNGFDEEIESIYIPKTIISFGNQAQEYIILFKLYKLNFINVDPENSNYSSKDGILFNKSGSKLIYYPMLKTGTEYIVPNSVTEIGVSAFSMVYYLNTLKFSSPLQYIGKNATSICRNLLEAEYPSYPKPSEKIILFESCNNLNKVIIGKDVTWMNDEDFYDSPNVVLYVYPDSYGLEWAQNHDFEYVIVEEEQPIEKELVDTETGIKVNGLMDSEATLKVESVENIVENSVATFDITLEKDGNIIQPSGEITISIPCEYDGCTLYWVKEDGSKEEIVSEYVDGFYVFKTTHLSIYTLVKEVVSTDPEPTTVVPDPTEPTTVVPDPTEPTTVVPDPTEPTTVVPDPTEPTTVVPDPTEPTTVVPDPTEPTTVVPDPTESTTVVPDPTEPTTVAPDPTEPTTVVPDPTESTTIVPDPTESTTVAPDETKPVEPVTPTDGNNNSNSNTTSSSNNTSNGAVATGDMFGIDNSILIAIILAATTAMMLAMKRRKDSSK